MFLCKVDTCCQERFGEYPKLKELMELKDGLVAQTATPPMYLAADLRQLPLAATLATRFDAILIEPPVASSGFGLPGEAAWDWDAVANLDIPGLADARCFIWLWLRLFPSPLQ